MSLQLVSACELHVPHKEWSGDERERQNYLEIERWSHRLGDCFTSGGSTGAVSSVGSTGAVSRRTWVGDLPATPSSTTPARVNFAALGSPDGHSPIGSSISLYSPDVIVVLANGYLGWVANWQFRSVVIPKPTSGRYRGDWDDGGTTDMTQYDIRYDKSSPLVSSFYRGPANNMGGGMYVTAGARFAYYRDQNYASYSSSPGLGMLFGIVVSLVEF